VRVQGETSAAEVAAAVEGFNGLRADGPIPRPDLLIVARGGGSIEDLWGFNEEIVVRAVAGSAIPVISAVGHETDTTLCDYAADLRVPTPTAAAEAAVPVRVELIGRTEELELRQRQAMRRQLGGYRDRIRAAAAELPRPLDLVATARQRIDLAETRLRAALGGFRHRKALGLAALSPRLTPDLLRRQVEREGRALAQAGQRLAPAVVRLIAERRQRLSAEAKLMASLSYRGVLARGFALVSDAGGKLVRSAGAVTPGEELTLEFADGRLGVVAGGEAEPAPAPKKRRAKAPSDAGGQQSLF
jgi:exodeoxyribonuclease VII large subunit